MASISSTRIPRSASSSSASWDVYLSFRGEDTRSGFVAYLYDTLDRLGFRTYKDDLELASGEYIVTALLDGIMNSKTYIIVLSENYASSPWCLDELVEILKCSRKFGRVVIPVFYKIDPSVVRHQIGSFKAAFEKHEEHFVGHMQKMNHWRLALKDVANFSGLQVDQSRSEVDTIKEVVDFVLHRTNPTTLDIAKYPTGIDSHVAKYPTGKDSHVAEIEIKTWLIGDIHSVRYVGIWGMGGIGKTTLAKVVFNANFHNFEACCFLENIRKAFSQPKGPQDLQKQLIADVLKISKDEINKSYINELIIQIICRRKILIVFDDVNDQNQLNSLVEGPYAPGSVIILTTRHKDLLDDVGVKAKYQHMVKELDDADSRQLFNKRAFDEDEHPSDELLEFSKEILQYAGGLPLALVILGSSLRYRHEARWRFSLKELGDFYIMDNLFISFKSLADHTLEEMFLDIACFFVGYRREDVVPILGSCYADVDAKIDRLMSRSLIKTGEYNEISMHGLVMRMGWKIVRQFSGKDKIQRHSRVYGWKDIYRVLDDNKGTEAIECMVDHSAYRYNCRVTFDTDTFKRTPKLRFLKMKGVNLSGSFEQIFKNLRWLHWYRCPLETLPSDFCPEEIVILELHDSKIIRWNLSKDFRNLKILDLSGSVDLITSPDFNRFPCLEKISLRFCSKLKEVDTSIGDLKNLVSLNLMWCTSLRRLPASVCKLTALENLDIGYCHSLEVLPEELGNMRSLTKLVLGSPHITKLPDSIIHLTKLVTLKLYVMKLLERLPDISNFKRLERLQLRNCSGLTEIDGLDEIISIRQVDLKGCRSIKNLSNLSNLKQLETLELSECSSLTEIEGLGELTSITYLDLEGCRLIKRLPNLSNLKQLETLELSECSSLTEIEGLGELTSITYLDLEGCRLIKRLPNISNLKQLGTLKLSDCSSLAEIEGLEELTSITYLDLEGCGSLKLANSSDLSESEGFEGLTSIEEFDKRGCYSTDEENTSTSSLFQKNRVEPLKLKRDNGDDSYQLKWIKRNRVKPLELKRDSGDLFYQSQFVSGLLAFTVDKDKYESCMTAIRSSDTVQLNQGIKEFAEATQKDPRLVQLLTSEDVELIIKFLGFEGTISVLENKPIQYHAAAILAKVPSVACLEQQIKDAVPALVQLLSDQNENFGVQIQTLSALTRIAYTFPESCGDIVKNDALSHLMAIVTKWKLKDDDMILHCSSFLGAVCSGHLNLSTDERNRALYMAKTILRCEIMPEACVALAKLYDRRYMAVEPEDHKLVEPEDCKLLILYLSDYLPSTIASALEVVSNIIRWGSNSDIQCVIDNGIMRPLQRLLFHDHKILKKEACSIILNIIALINEEVVEDANLIDDLCKCLNSHKWDVTIEAVAHISLIESNSNAIDIRLLETVHMLGQRESITSEAKQMLYKLLNKGGPQRRRRRPWFKEGMREAITQLIIFT